MRRKCYISVKSTDDTKGITNWSKIADKKIDATLAGYEFMFCFSDFILDSEKSTTSYYDIESKLNESLGAHSIEIEKTNWWYYACSNGYALALHTYNDTQSNLGDDGDIIDSITLEIRFISPPSCRKYYVTKECASLLATALFKKLLLDKEG